MQVDLESVVRLKCDGGYLCANFGLPVLELFPMYGTDRHHHGSALQVLEEKKQGHVKFMGPRLFTHNCNAAQK